MPLEVNKTFHAVSYKPSIFHARAAQHEWCEMKQGMRVRLFQINIYTGFGYIDQKRAIKCRTREIQPAT